MLIFLNICIKKTRCILFFQKIFSGWIGYLLFNLDVHTFFALETPLFFMDFGGGRVVPPPRYLLTVIELALSTYQIYPFTCTAKEQILTTFERT